MLAASLLLKVNSCLHPQTATPHNCFAKIVGTPHSQMLSWPLLAWAQCAHGGRFHARMTSPEVVWQDQVSVRPTARLRRVEARQGCPGLGAKTRPALSQAQPFWSAPMPLRHMKTGTASVAQTQPCTCGCGGHGGGAVHVLPLGVCGTLDPRQCAGEAAPAWAAPSIPQVTAFLCDQERL